ncbi:MAG TPA: glycosyltransferase family 9 protein [Pyrinomonadaceae bacterium]|nr:glycosyltransferase family 9 protein [Pyrinomonadaceae bacterium]
MSRTNGSADTGGGNRKLLRKALQAEAPVVFFINGIGDNILNLPALRALCALFPDRLSMICSGSDSLFMFDDLPLRRAIKIRVEKSTYGREFDADAVAAETGNCDLFLSLVPWHSESLTRLVEKLRPQLSVGYFSNYDIRLPLNFDQHTCELAFDLVRLFDERSRLQDFTAPPCYPNEARAEARQLREQLSPGAKALVVHADTGQKKMWDSGKLMQTLDTFLGLHPEFTVLLVGGSAQSLDCGLYGDRVIPCYGLPLPVSMALVTEADFFLGVDSCMLHAADFAGVPSVGLFGPTSAAEFGFLVGPHIAIQAPHSMEEIEATDVADALESLLAEPHQFNVRYLSTPHVERRYQVI